MSFATAVRRLRFFDASGRQVISTTATSIDGSATETGGLPSSFILAQNYPNPFAVGTTIPFTLERPGEVRLAVYDVLGREVAVLVDGRRPAGTQQVSFEAAGLPGGVYLARLEAEGKMRVRRMVLVK